MTACNIDVEDDDFSLTLPITVCRRCGGRPPFPQAESDIQLTIYPIAVLLATLFFAAQQFTFAIGCLALVFLVWYSSRPSQMSSQDRSTRLRQLLSQVPAYHSLLQCYPDAVLSSSERLCSRTALNADQFFKSVRFHNQVAFLSSESEFAESRIPAAVANALATILHDEVAQFVRSDSVTKGYAVQVSCAVLPGRRNAFEIQGLPGDLKNGLLERLSSVPSWPVAFPFVFVVQRRINGGPEPSQPQLEAPFFTWWRLAGMIEEHSFAQVAMLFHQIKREEGPIEVKLEDIEAIRLRLPDAVGIAVHHAELLSLLGQHDASIAVIDTLIERHPAAIYFRQHRASALESAGRFEHAAAECQAMLADFPDDVSTLGYLAHLQLAMGRPQDALATVSQALEREEQSKLFFVRARVKFALEQFDAALSDLNVVLFQEPDSVDVYLLRARIYLQRENYEKAIADLEQYHRSAVGSIESLSLLATAYRGSGTIAKAVGVYDQALIETPDHPVLKIQRAELLAESGKLELAREDCESVLGQFPDFAYAYATRAAIHLESGRHEAALHDGERAGDLGMDNSRLSLILGLAKAAGGNLELGEAELTRATELDSTNGKAWFHRGCLKAMRGEFSAAIDDMTMAIECYSDWQEALVHRGFLRMAIEQPDAAWDDFERAIQLSPGMADAYRGRAAVHTAKKNTAQALADLNKAVLLDPDNAACRLARTHLLLSEGERDAAKADLDSALQLEPDLIPALFQRAHLHLSLGQYEAARQDFDDVLQNDPDATSAFIGRSVAWEQAGDLEAAERDIDEAAQAAPQNAEQLELGRLLLTAWTAHNNQQFDKAVTCATQAIELNPDCLDAYRLRASAHWYSEQFVEALDDYCHLIETDEQLKPSDFNGRGQVYAEMGECEQALEDLTRAIELARVEAGSNLAFCLNGRGRALTGLKRFDEAEADFVESLRLKPDNAWLHFNRGLLYLAKEERENAVACFELSLSVSNPALPPRKKARAQGFLNTMTKPDKLVN